MSESLNDYKLSKMYLQKYKNAGKEDVYKQRRKNSLKKQKPSEIVRERMWRETAREYFLVKLRFIESSPLIVSSRTAKLNIDHRSSLNYNLYLLVKILNNFLDMYNHYHTDISIKIKLDPAMVDVVLNSQVFDINCDLIDLCINLIPELKDCQQYA
jgi:hypothetical protein